MSTRLNILIYSFLKEHRESDSGWAQITSKDMSLLHKLIKELIELKCNKCDKDADGDLPIEFVLVNRRTHESLQFDPVPYRDREISHEQMMQILMMNLGIAHNRLDTEFRVWQHRKLEKWKFRSHPMPSK